MSAADVVDMRAAIAKEKGDADRWDLKYAAGGLIDIEFIAQYLQLVHAAALPEILDTSTARTLEKAARPGILGLLARAADLRDFPTLAAHLAETQRAVRACFVRILGGPP